jgi:hypothetical protein
VKVSHAKTVRFQSVVEMCGQPEIVQLWSAPRANRPFMAAARQNRLATLFQETVGTKKDWAIVGFHERPRASYLIFPKPLTAFAERRIVGVKYELIKTPGPLGRVLPPAPEHRAGNPTLTDARIPGPYSGRRSHDAEREPAICRAVAFHSGH